MRTFDEWVDLEIAQQLGFTCRRLDVLLGMAAGKTNDAIGRELFIVEDTVKMHVKRVFRHLGAQDRASAVGEAYDCGLLRTRAMRDALSAICLRAVGVMSVVALGVLAQLGAGGDPLGVVLDQLAVPFDVALGEVAHDVRGALPVERGDAREREPGLVVDAEVAVLLRGDCHGSGRYVRGSARGNDCHTASLLVRTTNGYTSSTCDTYPNGYTFGPMQSAAVATLTTPAIACTDHSCTHATSPIDACDCSRCFGDGHGAAHRERFAAVRAAASARMPGGFASAMTLPDEDIF